MYILVTFAFMLILSGCNSNNALYAHHGAPFLLDDTKLVTIKEMDQSYKKLIRYNQAVRIKGTIKYQCKIKGAWAFIDDNTGLVLVDFLSTSPNILIPKKQLSNPIVIEGYLKLDPTVVNDYNIFPYAFEFQPIER